MALRKEERQDSALEYPFSLGSITTTSDSIAINSSKACLSSDFFLPLSKSSTVKSLYEIS